MGLLEGPLESLPFRDGEFDVVTGFNSFQYAASPEDALVEARRVTRKGGRVLMMVWGEPAGMEASSLVAAVKPDLPPAPPGAPGPFALSGEDALRKLAKAANLRVQQIFDVDSPWQYHDRDEALRGLKSSGVAAKAIAHSGA